MHLRTKIFEALLLTIALAVIAGACGGSGESTSTLTKAAFIKRADAICAKADEEQVKLLSNPPKGSSERQAIDAALGVTRKQAEKLAALGAPSGEEQQVATVVEAIEAAVSQAEDVPLAQVAKPFQKPDRLAAAYGFEACSEAL